MIPKDAIEILKDIQQKDLDEADFLGKCAIDMAITALKEDRPQWIPCSDRLPEEDGKYLVKWVASWGAEIRIADYSRGGKYWYEDATGYEYRGVTAWMPLPEPYEEGEKK